MQKITEVQNDEKYVEMLWKFGKKKTSITKIFQNNNSLKVCTSTYSFGQAYYHLEILK